jgi:hypothetical protein
MKKLFLVFLITILTFWNSSFAQQSECRVLKAEISGTYSGGCKNGLAQGKGIAQGTDQYEGQFSKGLPDGRGTYTWANGTYYDGQWKNGKKDGSGKMVYKDSVVTGYWIGDKYSGKKLISPYVVIYSTNVIRYSITKTSEMNEGVKIKIMLGGGFNSSVEDLSLAYDSGEEYRNGQIYGIQNTKFPLKVKVKYRSWNQLRTSQIDVQFEFTINFPGTWDVEITN